MKRTENLSTNNFDIFVFEKPEMFLIFFLGLISCLEGANLPPFTCEDQDSPSCTGSCSLNNQEKPCIEKREELPKPLLAKNSVCETQSGYTCQFPFQEDFRLYEACTDYDQGVGQ